jgi:hypothetical protein
LIDEQIKHYLTGHIQILLHLVLNLQMTVLRIQDVSLESEVNSEESMLEKASMHNLQ